MTNTQYRIHRLRMLLSSLLGTIYFNFHYLPFRQAVRLPIWIHKADLLETKGKVIIDAVYIRPGMITMGFREVSIYPNSGVVWENKGGTVIFRGQCAIGNASFLSFGPNTTVDFGDDFRSRAALKLVSVKGIKFGVKTSIGWDSLIMDTNFHPIYNMVKKEFAKASGPIVIGDYNWFGTGCRVMHSVHTPERCIFGMGTIVTRGCEAKSYCLMGGSPVRILSENVMRDYEHDTEEV